MKFKFEIWIEKVSKYSFENKQRYFCLAAVFLGVTGHQTIRGSWASLLFTGSWWAAPADTKTVVESAVHSMDPRDWLDIWRWEVNRWELLGGEKGGSGQGGEVGCWQGVHIFNVQSRSSCCNVHKQMIVGKFILGSQFTHAGIVIFLFRHCWKKSHHINFVQNKFQTNDQAS